MAKDLFQRFVHAYEFLMTMYASNAGKSGGEFFTPSDVSELLTRLGTVGKTKVNKVYERKTFSSVSFRFSSWGALACTLQNSSEGSMKKPFSCTSPSRASSASASESLA